jgi:KDO2-lipid IV(A) lauroyltransferase
VILSSVPHRLVPEVGNLLGKSGWVLSRTSRRIALSQLKQVYPDSSESWREEVGRELFAHLGLCLVETVKLPRTSREERMQRITVEGLDIFQRAYDRGKGVLAVTGHIGNWEVLAAAFCDFGFPMNVVGRVNPNPWLESMIRNMREGYGATVLDRDRDARRMLRCLRNGEVLGILVDQDTKVEGMFLPFLGRDAHTPVGHGKLAARTGASVVVLTINRHPDRRGHHIKVWEEVPVPTESEESEFVPRICERCNYLLENAIRAQPSQWVWFHRRWRTKQKKTTPDVLHEEPL